MANPFASIVGQRRAQSLLSRGAKMPINFGPWPRGLVNNLDYAIGQFGTGVVTPGLDFTPEQAVSAVNNLDFTLEGTAVSRLGRREYATGIATPSFITLLGSFEEGGFDGFKTSYGLIQLTKVSGDSIVLSVLPNNTGAFQGFFPQEVTLLNQYTALGFRFTDAVKYNDRIYLITPYGGNLAVSSGSRLSSTPMTWTAQPTIPVGSKGLIIKERMFVINTLLSRVYYSKATDPTTWSAPDGGFFDVNKGDGCLINNVVYVNNILYIFKDSGVYVFTFTTDPGIDGYLRKLNDYSFYDAIVLENGQVFAINEYGLWTITNTTFNLISQKVNLKPLPQSSRIIRVNKLLYIDNYVYNIITGAWSYHDNIKVPVIDGIAWDTKTSIRVAHLQSDYTRDLTITEGKTPGSISVINNIASGSNAFSYLDFLLSDNHWSKPAYALQTRMFRLDTDKLMRLGIPEIEWYLTRGNPYSLSATLKLCRSLSSADPTAPDTSKLDGNVLNNTTGKLFTVSNTSNSFDLEVSKAVPNPVGAAAVRSLSLMLQFYSPKVIDAADVHPTTYYLGIRMLRVLAGIPQGTVNSTDKVSN